MVEEKKKNTHIPSPRQSLSFGLIIVGIIFLIASLYDPDFSSTFAISYFFEDHIVKDVLIILSVYLIILGLAVINRIPWADQLTIYTFIALVLLEYRIIVIGFALLYVGERIYFDFTGKEPPQYLRRKVKKSRDSLSNSE